MRAYLNERSFEEYIDLAAALEAILLSGLALQAASAVLYRDSAIFFGTAFKQRFSGTSLSKDIRPRIRELVFTDRYFRCWRPTRASNAIDLFECSQPRFTFSDESLGEAATLSIDQPLEPILTLCAADSAFGELAELEIARTSPTAVTTIPTMSAAEKVRSWIALQVGSYDTTRTSAPQDFETVLVRDASRFTPTKYHERRFGRRVYEESESRYLYYVDDAHPGPSAHLEVFSRSGEHLGKADINSGAIQSGTRVNGRRFKP